MIEDRAYQSRSLVDARAAFSTGKRAVLLVGPTGMGKTTVASMAARGALEKEKRIALIAHRRELLSQATARFRSFGFEVSNRIETPSRVYVVGAQKILARKRLPEADLVILDEAHHYAAATWGTIPETYLKAGARLLGLSATPERGDGIGLGGIFDHLIVVAQIRELTDLGYLVPCRVSLPKREVNTMALEPWDAYQRYASGRAAVVFAPHVKAAEDFAKDFIAHGIPAGVVHGELPEDERDRALARFACGELRVLCNVMVLTEGWDCPIADVCILARLIGSPSLYLQMVGRILRPCGLCSGCIGRRNGDPSSRCQKVARLVDLCGNYDLHGHPSEDRVWSLVGQACTRWGDAATDGVRHCPVCKAEIPTGELTCAECGEPLPVLQTPKGEDTELIEAEREAKREERRGLPEDKRVRMLASLYARGIRKGHKKRAAEMAYRSMTGRFPDTKLMVQSWKAANETVAQERGDAYEPPIVHE